MNMTPEQASVLNRDLCLLAPVVPVLVLDDAALAADLARALIAGGLPALEVTLRTPAALDAIREMAAIPGGVVGAGTLLTPKDVENAKATASEAMRLLERGYTVQKFFPAEANGGVPALKAIGAPIPQVKFCPTGGVSLKNAPDYLALSNTLCVGGSWVAPKDLMLAGDWAGIEALAREAAALKR